jgi:hypothetical protein
MAAILTSLSGGEAKHRSIEVCMDAFKPISTPSIFFFIDIERAYYIFVLPSGGLWLRSQHSQQEAKKKR